MIFSLVRLLSSLVELQIMFAVTCTGSRSYDD